MIDWLTPMIASSSRLQDDRYVGRAARLGRMMVNAGWDDPGRHGRARADCCSAPAPARFLFVVQETEPPYCLNVVELSRADDGQQENRRGRADVGRCMRADRWPGYPLEIVKPEYPGWAEQQWLEREMKEAARAMPPRRPRSPEDGRLNMNEMSVRFPSRDRSEAKPLIGLYAEAAAARRGPRCCSRAASSGRTARSA
jgi:hypothetical protein